MQRYVVLLAVFFLLRAPAQAQLVQCSVPATSPVAIDDYAKWPGGAVVIDVLANDFDGDGDPFSITGFSPAANGTVAYTDDFEALLYTPTNTNATTDQFSYSISDGQHTTSGTVYLQAEGAPPPPPPPPEAEVWFTYACTGVDCRFLAQWQNIADTPRYYHWEWGNNQTTPPYYSGRGAQHDYTPGTHSARLTITFVSGNAISSGWREVVVAAPNITCTLEVENWGLLTNVRVRNLSNNGSLGYDYYVDYGDPSIPLLKRDAFSAQQPSGGTYRTPGLKTIRYYITATNDSQVLGQCVDQRDYQNHAPEPDFEAVPGDGVTRAEKLFRFTPTSYDEFFLELGPWEWNFGDGTFATTSGASGVDHYYPRPGNYTVTLKVTDFLGASGTISKTITAKNDPPTVNWKFNCAGRNCRFDASESFDDSGVLTYSWSFGDSTQSGALETPTTTHTFAADQPYDVTLTVSDGTESVARVRKVTPRAAPLASALVFYTLPPCRVADTRLDGRPPLNSGTTTEIAVAGICGVPANAKAVAGNITVVSPTNTGHLRVYPFGTTPADASSINFTPARSPRSNNGIFALGASGSLAVNPLLAPSGTVHFVLDVTGYFTDDLTAANPLRYDRWGAYWRIYDSRQTPPALTSGTIRNIKVRNAAIAYLPMDAEAMWLNFTTLNPTSTGNLTVFPSNLTGIPLAAAMTFQANTPQANGSLMALGRRTNDDLSLVMAGAAGSTTDFTIDTEGWFARNATHRYYTIQPCRAADTRKDEHGGPRLTPNSEHGFQIQGNCGVPFGAKFALVNATVVNTAAAGTGRIGSIYEGHLTNLQFGAGDTVANTYILPLSPTLESYCCISDTWSSTSVAADLILDVLGYFMPEENVPPVANADAKTAVINVASTIDVLQNDTDANADELKLSTTAAVFNPPRLGTATRTSDTSITYTSALAGTDTFDYEVVDARGGKSHGRVTMTVRATNGAPVAVDDTGGTAANSSVTIDALANDSDPENDALTITAVAKAAKGTAEVAANRILYTPNETATGTDTFNYTVKDEFGAADTGSVTITITGVNHPPVAVEDSTAVLVGQPITITPLANDTDADGDTLALSDPAITEGPSLGAAVRTSDTTITYTAGAAAGADVFQYSMTDGRGASARGAITVQVHRAPVAVNDSATVRPGQSLTINVLANDSDPDSNPIALATNAIVVAPAHGTAVRASATSITYTAGTVLGSDVLTYEIADSYGATARAQLAITINSTPVAVDDTVAVNLNVPVTVNVLTNDSDPDGDAITLTPAAIVIAPLRGTATRASDTSITYTATSAVSGTDVLTYELTDARGAKAQAKLNVTINRPPAAAADNAVVQSGIALAIDVLANDTDPDANPLSLDSPAIVQAPASGTAVVDADGRRILYTPGASLTASFTYAVIDGKGGRAVGTVNVSVNRLPVAVADTLTVTNDAAATDLVVTANDTDPDSDAVKLTASPFKTQPAKGTATRKNDTTIAYTPTAGSSGTDTFNVEVTDGRGGLAVAAVTVTIHRRPVAVADTALVNQDQSITINVVANDTDADGDTLLLPATPITVAPTVGTAVRASNTSITYNATNTGASASTFFDYKVSDSRNTLSAAAARVTVTINRKPVATADSVVAINNGTAISINVTANDTDAEADVIRLTAAAISRPPALGTAVRASDTTITYTPNGVGTTTFDYQIVDARGAGPVTGTVTVRIDPPNRAPVANADTGTATAQNTALDINVTANDSDPDGDTFTVSFAGTTPKGTTSILSGTTIRFMPTSGYAGRTTFQYRIKDSKNAESELATVTAQIPGEIVRVHGVASDIPVAGDWNGDGIDDIGLYRPSTMTWYLDGVAPFVWGVNQWDLPVAGDWDGDGKDEVGLYRDTFAQWFLRNTPTTAFPGTTVNYGTPGWKPVVGDWNGDNKDDLGVFSTDSATFALQGQASFVFGLATDLPVAGDWNKDNKDEVGVYRPSDPTQSQATFYLRHSASYTQSFVYGARQDRPIAGDFGGAGRDSVGFVQYLGNTWRMNVGATGW
jgi:hypothetical protein